MPLRHWAPALGVTLLAAAWWGPLPDLAARSFTAHMTLHLLVVAVAAPLVALGVGLSGAAHHRGLQVMSPLAASAVELVVVWLWHTPRLHHLARTQAVAFAAEQLSFLAAGLLLWLSIVGAVRIANGRDAGTAVVALLLTLAHMTLLGALLGLSPRPLYAHITTGDPAAALADQQLGGVLMLAVSAVVYIGGGLVVGQRLLHPAARRGVHPA